MKQIELNRKHKDAQKGFFALVDDEAALKYHGEFAKLNSINQ